MSLRPYLLALLFTLGGFQRALADDFDDAFGKKPLDPPKPSVIKGRVVDGEGVGVENVELKLTDTTRLSGYVDSQGCGTYHPMKTIYSGSNGWFQEELPFTPNIAEVDFGPEGFAWPQGTLPVTAGQPLEVKVRRIAWVTYEGQVVDDQGTPLVGVSLDLGGRTDETGHFKLRLDPEEAHEQLRLRKIGFKPLVVPLEETARVVLRERRALLTVKLVDKGTRQPVVERMYRVEAYQGAERLSYCTAGDTKLTHEPAEGECTLDADPGEIELQVDRKAVRKLKVTDAPQTLTFEVTAAD